MDMQNVWVMPVIITVSLLLVSFVVLFVFALFIATKNSKKLIMIDDNQELLGDLKSFFERYGINTTAVSTTEEFDKELKTGKFDFALLDLGLEKDDLSKGIELFHKLHIEKQELQTFILSGHPSGEAQDKFKDAFSPEIQAGASWETLWRDIHSHYFSKGNIQDLIRLAQEIRSV